MLRVLVAWETVTYRLNFWFCFSPQSFHAVLRLGQLKYKAATYSTSKTFQKPVFYLARSQFLFLFNSQMYAWMYSAPCWFLNTDNWFTVLIFLKSKLLFLGCCFFYAIALTKYTAITLNCYVCCFRVILVVAIFISSRSKLCRFCGSHHQLRCQCNSLLFTYMHKAHFDIFYLLCYFALPLLLHTTGSKAHIYDKCHFIYIHTRLRYKLHIGKIWFLFSNAKNVHAPHKIAFGLCNGVITFKFAWSTHDRTSLHELNEKRTSIQKKNNVWTK